MEVCRLRCWDMLESCGAQLSAQHQSRWNHPSVTKVKDAQYLTEVECRRKVS